MGASPIKVRYKEGSHTYPYCYSVEIVMVSCLLGREMQKIFNILAGLALTMTAHMPSIAQKRTYDISLSYGLYVAPSDFAFRTSKDYWSGDFTFHVSNRWSVTSGFLAGSFNYYDTLRSNAWDEVTKYSTTATNARGYDLHAFAFVNYDLLNAKNAHIQIGTGAGFVTQRLKYPYRQPCSSGCQVFIGEESTSSFEFPINLRTYYLIAKRLGIGLAAGGFITTKFKLTGSHVGPQVRLRL